jgi:hypothetical protein
MDKQRTRRGTGRWVPGAVLAAAGVVGGALLAGTLSAAASSTSTAAPGSAGSYAAGPEEGQGRGHGGTDPVRGDEKSVSSDVAAKLKAAALKAVPGGTVYRVETDAGDAAYEAHMTKSDGSLVTVKFDKNLNATGVEDGMGKGDPAPSGQWGNGQAPGDGQAPGGGESSSSTPPPSST